MNRFRCWLICRLGGTPPLRMRPYPEPSYMAELREWIRTRPAPEWREEQ